MSVVPEALSFALELIDDAALVVDASDGDRVVWVSPAFTRASGFSATQAIGQRQEELQRPREGADGQRVSRKDGTDARVTRRRATLPGGGSLVLEIQRSRAVHDDASSAVLAEASRDIISRVDARGVCTYVSPSVAEILGYTPDELVGSDGFRLAHPDERAATSTRLAETMLSGASKGDPVIARVRHKNGSYVWLEHTSRILRDAAGAPTGFQLSARDVSQRVRVEEALARSQRDFRELLEALPEAACIHRSGVCLYANPQFASLVGRPRGELLGTSLLDLVHPSDRALVARRINPNERDYRPFREHTIVRADGSDVSVEIAALPIVFEEALADLTIVRDLSERRRLEAQLTVSERLASVGRLAAAVGHEVKNPLLYMLGSLELLRQDVDAAAAIDPALATSMREHLTTAREAAGRVRGIVHDLRELVVAPGRRTDSVDLHRALDVAAAMAEHELKGRARLEKDYGAGSTVVGDERRLVQVFVNLLVNAAHATPPGDPDANVVRISTRQSGGDVVAEVIDTGTGLPTDAERIFEPFYTTKPGGVGTGLGLAVSHQIVTSFGGSIVAERRSPRGALFRVRLPMATEEPSRKAGAPATPEALVTPARILLVDDERNVTTTLARLLVPHEVVISNGVRDAIARLDEDRRFDAIVCDLQMLDGSAADIYDHLGAIAPELQARMIFMTGGAYTERAKSFLASSERPCLEKPFAPSELLAVIATARGH